LISKSNLETDPQLSITSVLEVMRKIVAFLFILTTVSALGQSEPEDLIKKFFKEYEEEGAFVALDNLYSNNKWMSTNQEAVDNLKTQLNDINNVVGEYYGYEPITKKTMGKSFVLYSYLVKYDRQPIRFTFEFYKPNDKWMTFYFAFDENLDEELEESAKIQFLIKDN